MNCKPYVGLLLLGSILFLTDMHVQAAYADDPKYRRPFPVPEVPPGAVLVVYGPVPRGIMGAEAEKAMDWKGFLIKRGIVFPKDGFALFYLPARVLLVATDETNHNLVKIIFE